ncbi:Rne/Rng family ribonuclease [Aquibaculum sediminis]|uniref:Rne/Rng family ribonuclease n=1 Tax=Aquibaculum sediminis TaxID=3231907 RepID=UPI003F627BF9
MAQRMLIDATRPGEARVVVLSGNRVEEFDYETATKTQVKGNIYLAKVTRVEPSLQAAFVEYGGNRHGFLPFSEIHPDYYRLPIADREKLIAEEAAERARQSEKADAADSGDGDERPSEGPPESAMDRALDQDVPEEPDNGESKDGNGSDIEVIASETSVDTIGGDDIEDAARRRAQLLRKYKIQEVVKRRQVMLVQVTKEERGNKGAALTTYLSLAGRYCVLMPNTAKGGGISRKISSAADRRRLKSVVSELEIPEGMAVIVRTAGSQRTKTEIRRDYEYLLRLWDDIRNKTLESSAPCLVHEEANLIKRAIRDVYTREMDSIEVEGEEGYKAARSVMRMLMPSHVKKITHYKEAEVPLFQKHRVEEQLEAMHAHTVQLRSGGSIVLNPTEALVAIDVNSGKATSERHIEETAFKTNLEAADEIARQLRLRDLAGLIVIDFIDMEESRHNREVERRLKEAMKQDRARIQLGRISPFGLLELSRQRLRPSLFETVNIACPTCRGLGHLRSPDSLSLSLMHQVADEAARRGAGRIEVQAPGALALYLLNEKRSYVQDMENRFGITLFVRVDDNLGPQEFVLRRLTSEGRVEERRIDTQQSAAPATIAEESETETSENGDGKGRSSSRGRRRGGRSRNNREESAEASAPETQEVEEVAEATQQAEKAPSPGEDEDEQERASKRRRRGRRGGRRRRSKRDDEEQQTTVQGQDQDGQSQPDQSEGAGSAAGEPSAEPADQFETAEDAGEPVTTEAAPAAEATAGVSEATEASDTAETADEEKPAPKKRSRRSPRRKTAATTEESAAEATPSEGETETGEAESKPKRRRAPRRKTTAASKAPETASETSDEPAGEGVGETPAQAADEPVPQAEAEPVQTPASAPQPKPQEQSQPEPAAEASPQPDVEPTSDGHAGAQHRAEPDRATAHQPAGEGETAVAESEEEKPARPRRRGWWARG